MKRALAAALAMAVLAFIAGYVVGNGTTYDARGAVIRDESSAADYGRALAQAAYPDKAMDEYVLWAAYYNDTACVWAVSFIGGDMSIVRVEFLATDLRLLSKAYVPNEPTYPAL